MNLQDSEQTNGRSSPSLDDLEMKKKALLDALLNDDVAAPASKRTTSESKSIDNQDETSKAEFSQSDTPMELASDEDKSTDKESVSNVETSPTEMKDSQEAVASTSIVQIENAVPDSTAALKTPKAKTIRTEYGTPMVVSVTPYNKLPSDDKFAKDICDVINFENLPNSTGKYKQISTLLKKVKDEVDRIQDS